VLAARFMGAATVARLHADPAFRADLEGARKEMAATHAHGLTPAQDCAADATTLQVWLERAL
jgi:acid phosphatase (class A)